MKMSKGQIGRRLLGLAVAGAVLAASGAAFAELGQSLARKAQCFGIAIDANDASGRRSFKHCFAMSTQAKRAVDKESSSLGSEELNRFS